MPLRSRRGPSLVLALALVASTFLFQPAASKYFAAKDDRPLDAETVEKLSATQGTFDPEHDVYQATFARRGLQVTVNGVSLSPEMGLTAWTTLSGTRNRALLFGDFPLLEDEIDDFL